MKYPGSKRSNLFSKILGKVEKDLYQKPVKRTIDDLITNSLALDSSKHNLFIKRKSLKILRTELNIIQLACK